MKTKLMLALGAFLCMTATATYADGVVDPQIALGGKGSCQSFTETSLTQSFSGVTTGCIVDFTDEIADNNEAQLDVLVVNVTSPFTGTISCALGDGTPLNTAEISSPTSCTFLDVTEIESIDFGTTYGLTFDPNFGSSVSITLAPNVISPEPAAILLVLVGLPVLLIFKKGIFRKGVYAAEIGV